MPRAAIYCRVSTEEQAKSGYSLPDQIASCQERLLKMGYTDIVEYIDDGYSGEFLERPALSRLRDDVAQGRIDAVAVYDPDRLARKLSVQLLVAEELEKNNVVLHFITGDYDASPEGRLFFAMRGAIAEFEKAKILDRSVRGKRRKAAEGKIIQDFGLYGYEFNPDTHTYVIKPAEADIIRTIFSLVVDKKYSIESVQKELLARGIPSPTGKKIWPVGTIWKILHNETYTGEFISMKLKNQTTGLHTRKVTERPETDWIRIPVPAIIDRKTLQWAELQLQRNKHLRKHAGTYPFLLAGIIYCGVCGRRMITHYCVFRDGVRKPYYICAAHRYANLKNAGVKCPSRSLPAQAIDNDVWDKLIEVCLHPQKARQYVDVSATDYQPDLKKLTAEETTLLKQRETITRWYRQQILSGEEAEEQLKQITARLAGIQEHKQRLERIAEQKNKRLTIPEQIQPLLTRHDLSLHTKRDIITSLLARVSVTRIDHNGGSVSRPVFAVKWEFL